jgi:hypothetical protein
LMGVPTHKPDLRRGPELELTGQNEIAKIHDVLADRLVAVGALFTRPFLDRVGRAVSDTPLPDAASPALGAGLLSFGEGLRLIKCLRRDELVWQAGLRGRWGGISGRGAG